MITRRLVVAAAGVAAGLAAAGRPGAARAAPGLSKRLAAELARIERESGGRLGVAVLDTGSGARAGHRADERFPMCSTFKLLLAAAVLARVDAGTDALARRIRIPVDGLLAWSPATRPQAGGEMTLDSLCEAAMVVSDNTAANLILDTLGGPAGLTARVRALGDPVTRLDRVEPDLNEAVPGDPRDTTSPAAMLATLHGLALGDALSAASRDKLVGWLVGNRTGDARLRAGLPKDFRVGEKTGSGEHGTANDVGVIWPPGHAPLVVTAYLTETAAPPEQRDATLAAVGRAVAAAL